MLGEQIPAIGYAGGLLIFLAILLAELGPFSKPARPALFPTASAEVCVIAPCRAPCQNLPMTAGSRQTQPPLEAKPFALGIGSAGGPGTGQATLWQIMSLILLSLFTPSDLIPAPRRPRFGPASATDGAQLQKQGDIK
jgi:hypothetical protein